MLAKDWAKLCVAGEFEDAGLVELIGPEMRAGNNRAPRFIACSIWSTFQSCGGW